MMTPLRLSTALFLAISTATASAARPQLPFAPARPDGITTVTVLQGGDTARFLKRGGRWVTSRDRYPVDPYRMQDFLASLLSLQTLPVSPGSDTVGLSAFGLGPGEAKQVEWKGSSGKTHRVLLGKLIEHQLPEHVHDQSCAAGHGDTPLPPDSSYWKYPADSRVFRSPGNPGGYDFREEMWKDRTIFPVFVYMDVQSIEVEWRDTTGKDHRYRMDRVDDTSARLVKPVRAPLPRRNAAKVFVQTPQFAVDELVAPEDSLQARQALEEAQFRLGITLKNGRRLALQVGAASGNHHYARHPDYGLPVKIARWRLDEFRKTVAQLLDPAAIRHDLEDQE